MQIIVDTSAWIEYLRATGSRVDRYVVKCLQDKLELLMPAVVLQELLQGARTPRHYIELHKQLDAVPRFEPFDPYDLHSQAAMLYARCRWQGLTIRNPIDCVVAACAIEAECPLLARGMDFKHIASVDPRLILLP